MIVEQLKNMYTYETGLSDINKDLKCVVVIITVVCHY